MFFSPALFNPLLRMKNIKASKPLCILFLWKRNCESDLRTQSNYGWRYCRQEGNVKGDRGRVWGPDSVIEERWSWRLEKTPARALRPALPPTAHRRGRSARQTLAEEVERDFSEGSYTAKATSPRKPMRGKRLCRGLRLNLMAQKWAEEELC